MADALDLERYRRNLAGERESAALYRAMAEAEPKKELAELFRRLAATEEKHAGFWEAKIRAGGGKESAAWAPGLRTRFLIWLARRTGPRFVVPLVAAAEGEDRTLYDDQPESAKTGMPDDERSHARVLTRLVQAEGGLEGTSLARLEGRHRGTSGNALRAAVLGSADGLVSNLSLVMGVAGAGLAPRSVLVTGAAGLLAGACSMAIGEWVSVQSSREFSQRQIEIEKDELEQAPEEEEEELALIYQAKGLGAEEAKSLAHRLMADRGKALETLTREELGIDPAELGGSPWVAAGTSFALFAVGAALPLAPFAFLSGPPAIGASVAVSAVGLFAIGAAITLLTGRSIVASGLRQLGLGLAAAAVTFGLGRLVGAGLG